jgi:hypothetical protein
LVLNSGDRDDPWVGGRKGGLGAGVAISSGSNPPGNPSRELPTSKAATVAPWGDFSGLYFLMNER